ncbi:VWA domain-containing protein [Microbulbifer bruguierae]|uniref:VWA domain-containing protein n=1 Tax=Microbulbifer bruguierae TaxID=3029061 RepID=A0ABY8NI92_9GAMM|nr:VWA domain-containing protein [Microbulbifer bruguierae]WGL17283.1 VWA domain-containing protein [Microbulbifer bruguierae]
MIDLSQFHFLRPHVLWLIIPTAVTCWALARTILASGRLQKIIDPELLPYLLMRGGEKRPWLFGLIFIVLALVIIALAGPTWRKLPTPVYTNQDALVVLLDLSPSMMATDLAPNRLTRARLKILDILKQRKDGLTALVAYAGEAHVVTPLTDDTGTIANLVPSLSPQVMPVPGSNIEAAVQSGLRLIRDGASGHGEVLAVTDGIARDAISTIKGELGGTSVSLSVLAVGSGEGSPIPKTNGSGFITDDSGAIVIANFSPQELSSLAESTGGRYARIAVDDSDIAYLLPDKPPQAQAELAERDFDQWREEGPWLVLLLLPLTLFLFRRGTLACALPLALLVSTPKTEAANWQDLWKTPDQQAQELLREGKPGEAAELFESPQWRGTAEYRAGEYDAAAKNFAQSQDPRGLYNLGNSLTQQGRFDEAITAYDEALKHAPEFASAEHNRKIAEQLKKLQESQQQQDQQQDQNNQDQQQQSDQKKDQNGNSQDQQQSQENRQSDQNSDQAGQQQQQSEDGQQPGQQPEDEPAAPPQSEQPQAGNPQDQQSDEQKAANANESPLDPETQQALDQWLRQIPDDPAGLMREKFKYESLQRRRAYRTGEWQPPENGATQRW